MDAAFAGDVDPEADDSSWKGKGYYMCLCGWLAWITAHWREFEGCDAESVTLLVFKSLPKGCKLPVHATAFFERIEAGHPDLSVLIESLSNILKATESRQSLWTNDSLESMERRLESVQAQLVSISSDLPAPSGLRGWQRLQVRNGWKPCPIGS